MQEEKCVCHINGFQIKDAVARKKLNEIEPLLKNLSPDTIMEINKNSTLQIWIGTKEEFDALEEYDPGVAYFYCTENIDIENLVNNILNSRTKPGEILFFQTVENGPIEFDYDYAANHNAPDTKNLNEYTTVLANVTVTGNDDMDYLSISFPTYLTIDKKDLTLNSRFVGAATAPYQERDNTYTLSYIKVYLNLDSDGKIASVTYDSPYITKSNKIVVKIDYIIGIC